MSQSLPDPNLCKQPLIMSKLYCNRCKIVFESNETKCGRCGKKKLKSPLTNDVVYLTTRSSGPLSGLLEDLLKQNEIPFIRQEPKGSIPMAVFAIAFSFDYFVPYVAYDKAKELTSLVPESSSGRLPLLPL